MKRQHFEALQPICPVCRVAKRPDSRLHIGLVIKEEELNVIEGVLQCHEPQCMREYPIIDGVPILIGNIREFVSQQLLSIYGRTDLSDPMTNLVGECSGPGTMFDQTRQQLSSYIWDHYGELDPSYANCVSASRTQTQSGPQPGGVVRALEDVWGAAIPISHGPILDMGCSVGRTSFELAAETDEFVLGVDLNFAMLRWASNLLRDGRVRHACRDIGMVYRSVSYPASFRRSEKVDFWACDVLTLPFADKQFPTVVGMNLIDCVPSPISFLTEVGRVLQTQGKALLTTPFDWSPSATPIESWIGGHSGRGIDGGQCETVLRRILATEPGRSQIGLELIDAGEAPAWHVRLHARSTMWYQNHRVVLQSIRSESTVPTMSTTVPRQREIDANRGEKTAVSSANLA